MQWIEKNIKNIGVGCENVDITYFHNAVSKHRLISVHRPLTAVTGRLCLWKTGNICPAPPAQPAARPLGDSKSRDINTDSSLHWPTPASGACRGCAVAAAPSLRPCSASWPRWPDDDDDDDDDDDTAGGGAPGHAEPELRDALHARPPPGHRGHHAGHQGQVRTLAEEFLQSLTLFLIILFPHFMFQVTATERLLPDCERKCLASEWIQ